MAIKKNPIGSRSDDSLGLDFDDLDFGDPFAPSNEKGGKGNDNKPTKRLIKSFGAGMGKAMIQPDQVRRMASNAMPAGYGTAVNTAYEVVDLGANLYHSAAQELRPAMPVLRRAAGSLSQAQSKLLPAAVRRKLESFSKGGDDPARAQYDAETEMVNAQIGEVFGTMIEENARQREEDRIEGEIRNKIQDDRMVQTARIMDAVRQNTDRLVAYQDTVLARYQRKDLELKLRGYAIQRNMLALMTATEQRQSAQLTAIMKNTGLPEYRKTDVTEAARAGFRDRLLNNFQQQSVEYVAGFTRNLTKNLTDQVRNIAQQAAGAIEMADMGRDSIQSASEMGLDKKELFANMAGAGVVPILTRLMARPIQRRLSKNQKLANTGNRLQYTFGNVAERANTFAQSADDDMSLKGGLLRFVKEFLPRTGIDPTLAQSPLYSANEASPFDKQARRSLVEIIPGFLSRIHHELVMTRTGDTSVKRTVYNMDRGEFTGYDVAAGDARKRILHPHMLNYGRESVDTWVKELVGDHKLSDKTIEELKRQVMVDSVSGKYFTPERYSSLDSDTANLSTGSKAELEALLAKRFTNGDGSRNYGALSKHDEGFRRLKSAIYDPKSAMGVYMETGGREYLKDMGMIDRQGYTDRVNYSNFYDNLLNARPEDLSPDLDPTLSMTAEEREAARRRSTPYLAPGVMDKATRRGRVSLKKGWRSIKGRAKGMFDRARGAYDEVVEVYKKDDGGVAAVIDLAKLRGGEYYDDVSGKAVKRLDEVQGSLRDKSGRMVLSAKDMTDGFLADHPEVQKQLDKAKTKLTSLGKRAEKGTRRGRMRMERLRRSAMDGLNAKVGKYKDILTADGDRTLLEGARLMAGDYYDQASGKVLEKWEDIQGTVVDNKGAVIAAAKDIGRGLKDEDGNTPAWVGQVQNRIRREAKRNAVKGRRMGRRVGDMLGQARDQVNAEGKRLFDVYIGNGKHPRLEAAALAAGEYFDKASGRVLTSLDDIRGTVVDSAGNVVISAKDLGREFRDASGKRLNDLKERMRAGLDAGRAHLNSAIQSAQTALAERNGASDMGLDLAPLIEIGTRQIEIQTAIYEQLLAGIGPGDGSGGGEGGGRGGFLRRGLGMGLRGLRAGAKKYGQFAMAVWKAPFQAAGKLLGGARSLMGSAQEYMGDVRTAGGRIALTYVKMKNGDYFDVATGKPVREWRDIKGPVEDRSAQPPLTVLTAEEYQQGMYDTQGRRLFRAVGDVFARLGKFAGAVGGGYLSMVAAPFRALSWISRKIGEANAPQDVYVKGDPNPRVTVVEMQNGQVFDSDRKTKIKKWSEIRGQTFKVVDGNMRQAISLDEFKAGLVDYRGRALKRGSSILNGLGGLGGGVLGAAGKLAQGYAAIVAGAFKLGGNALGSLGRGLGRMFRGGGGRGMSDGEATVTLLGQIRDLLLERLPKPKKSRKGSYEDRLKGFADDRAKTKEEKKAEEKEKNGFLGKLMSKIGAGLGGLFGGGDDEDEDDEGGGGGNTYIMGGGGGDGKGRGKDGKGAAHRDAKGRKRGGMRRNMGARRKKWGRAMGRSRAGRAIGAATGWMGSKMPGFLRRNKGKAALAAGSAAARPGMLRRVGGRLSRFKPRSASLGGIASGIAMGLGADYAINKMTGGPNSTGAKAINTGLDVAGYGSMAYSLLGGGSMLAGGGAAAGGAGAAAAGTAAAGTAAAAGGMGAAGTAGTVIGGGALATIGLPILIGAAVVGGIAYIGYKGFKKYKYGTYTPLRAFRMAQYGFGYQDSGQGKMISELEQLLEPAVKQMGGGLDIAAGGEVTMEAIYKMFDLDDGWFSNNKEERAKFDVWFNNRFKPIFLQWITNLRAIKSGTMLGDADSDLTQEQKASLLKAVNNANPQIYNVTAGPFEGNPTELSAGDVGDAYKIALDTVEKEKTTWGKIKGKIERFGNGMAASTFGIFGADWATDWIDRKKKAEQLKDINARQADALNKTSEQYSKAQADAAKIGGTAVGGAVTVGADGKSASAGGVSVSVGGGKPGASSGGGLTQWASNMGAKMGLSIGAAAIPDTPAPPPLRGSAKEFQEMLLKEAMKAGITDKTELAMFLAQCAHESGNFRVISEGYNYSPARAAQIFKKYFRTPEEAAAAMAAGGKRAILDRAYQGRMGNTQPGDGFKFRGRGFIQLTGRDNYAKFMRASGINVLDNPDLLATDPKVAAQASIHWWLSRGGGIRAKAAAGDLSGVTRLVNGGENGLSDRAAHFRKFMNEMQGNTELNNVRANAATEAANSPNKSLANSTINYQFSQGVTNGSPTGGVGSAYQGSATGTPAAGPGVSPPAVGKVNYQMPAARPDPAPAPVNTYTLPSTPSGVSTPSTAAADQQRAADEDTRRRIAQQQEAAAAADVRGRASLADAGGESRQMADIASRQLNVQISMNEKLETMVGLLQGMTGAQLGKVANSDTTAGTNTAATGTGPQSKLAIDRERIAMEPVSTDTPISMRRNRKAVA